MIGFVCGENWTAVEFRPFFASSKMRWATICINKSLPDKYWGEWGFAFKGCKSIVIYSGNEIRFARLPRLRRDSYS